MNTATAERLSSNQLPYVVVANAGCDDERVVSEHRTYGEACAFNSDMDTDVMKRRADGSLTTEF